MKILKNVGKKLFYLGIIFCLLNMALDAFKPQIQQTLKSKTPSETSDLIIHFTTELLPSIFSTQVGIICIIIGALILLVRNLGSKLIYLALVTLVLSFIYNYSMESTSIIANLDKMTNHAITPFFNFLETSANTIFSYPFASSCFIAGVITKSIRS